MTFYFIIRDIIKKETADKIFNFNQLSEQNNTINNYHLQTATVKYMNKKKF
jgi:hypothetical protein